MCGINLLHDRIIVNEFTFDKNLLKAQYHKIPFDKFDILYTCLYIYFCTKFFRK